VQSLALSTSYFLLWVFLTTETLKAVNYASSANDPKLLPVRFVLLGLFVIGSAVQVRTIRRENEKLRLAAWAPIPIA
jgi:hypothetical protein